MDSIIEFGFKDIEEFYLEAYDLDDNEININNVVHYSWTKYKPKKISIGDTLSNEICFSAIYEFKDPGIYKVRFVFDPKYDIKRRGEILSDKVYSNWDTIMIK